MPRDDLREPVARAVTWFANEQTRGGWWLDLNLLGHPSDEYVTAFVAANVAGLPGTDQLVTRARKALLDRLRIRVVIGSAPGWGLNLGTPPDADSTAWGLRALGAPDLLASGIETLMDRSQVHADKAATEADIALARGFLMAHLTDAGVATYIEESGIRGRYDFPVDTDFGGWLGPAMCVTAAAAGPGGSLLPAAVPTLLAGQQADGSWRPYWWPENAYSTGLACLALRPQLHATPIVSAAGWAIQSGRSNSAFATAWRLSAVTCAVAAAPEDEQWRRARDGMSQDLLAAQLPDGSWPASAEIAVPAPSDRQPDFSLPKVPTSFGWGTRTLDVGRTLTTASVVAALARC